MNKINIIRVHKYYDTWVFDDKRVAVINEPFVMGVPEMIEDVLKDLNSSSESFNMLFSDEPFPGYHIHLETEYQEFGGCWYKNTKTKKKGWLCSALFLYFSEAPKNLYAKLEFKFD